MTTDPRIVGLAEAIRYAKRVYLCGNGGSAANALHVANDLVLCGIRAHALTGDIATLTAIANDHAYDEVFSRQLRVYGERDDLLIAFSGSGKSPNILLAIGTASRIGMEVCAIFGAYNAHQFVTSKDLAVIAEGDDMQAAEEFQLRIGHDLMRLLKAAPFNP